MTAVIEERPHLPVAWFVRNKPVKVRGFPDPTMVFFALSFIKPKRAIEWRLMGLFIGFIVALFTEMYGLPLTIYFLSQWLGTSYPVLSPYSHNNGHLWLVLFGVSNFTLAMTVLHLVSDGLMILGFYLLY